MARKTSRRELFKDVGVTSAATVLGAYAGTAESAQQASQQSPLERALALPSKELLAQHENYQVRLTTEQMMVTFDRRYGSGRSLPIVPLSNSPGTRWSSFLPVERCSL